ncbi:hypothetical protein JYU34_005133 [Plutella xylostella]|uniref:Chromo domain-containing protein n=1 Tax=Plutella xylostella TaxID=51655 RepID=A0ABQ7QVY1_PLUXY|nr:hypothetical protein JYU34_005133 [Plutella xylostella]
MVSTRGVRYKFTEGERVLCYEPDPTKAKVLYDSKVLEVIDTKDKRGRRSVEYLIHFQGWNSSWDRCVSEDFVLKDTEENRQLQVDLAEKSQLQLGAYLYRKERKKGMCGSGPGPAKRSRHGLSDDGSSTSTQPDAEGEGEENETSSAGDTDSSAASGSSQEPRLRPRAVINLTPALRDRLTFDYHLVVKRGRLPLLPASPTAAEILEAFVKWFARSGAWRGARRAASEPPHRPNLADVCQRLNLVREVADGLRVYFDFILGGHLLYRPEHAQYHLHCGPMEDIIAGDENEIKVKMEPEDENSQDEGNITMVEQDMKSPKIPEYSHLPPDPVDSEKSEGSQQSTDLPAVENIKVERNDTPTSDTTAPEETNDCTNKPSAEVINTPVLNNGTIKVRTQEEINSSVLTKADDSNSNNKGKEDVNNGTSKGKPQERCATRSGNLARRLRSHKSAVSQSETEEPSPSTSAAEPRAMENLSSSVGSSESSISSGLRQLQQTAPPSPAPARTPLSLLLDKVAKWEIIPREGTEHLPCRVYGAIHLARLFVKLPDFLNATQMPDIKLKMLLKHIDMFVQYLDEHNEWFGEMYYRSSSSRSR